MCVVDRGLRPQGGKLPSTPEHEHDADAPGAAASWSDAAAPGVEWVPVCGVVAESMRWYERWWWGDEKRRAERGRGTGLVNHEQLQARLERASTVPLLTLDAACH